MPTMHTDSTPHYLIVTIGTAGDIHPFMQAASVLRARGRRVSFITHSYHAALVESAGLPFVGLGSDEDYLRILADPRLWDPKHGTSALMTDYRRLLGQIEEAIRGVPVAGPAIALAHPFAVPGAAIARERGLLRSIVAAWLAPSNLRTCHDPLQIGPTRVPPWFPLRWRRALWRFVEKGWIDPVAVAEINAARDARGLPRIASLLDHIATAPDLSVSLFPSWFAPTMPDWPQPFVGGDFTLFEGSQHAPFGAELNTFLAAGEAPLVFTAGTGNLHARALYACALEAVGRLGRRAIFLARDRGQLPAQLSANVLWQPYVPLAALLPHAAALVHHGGIGTCAEALRAGVPQLVTPFGFDQFDNGARLVALGVGAVAPARGLGARTLARRLEALAGSAAVRARCAEVAGQFAGRRDPAGLWEEVERRVMQASPRTAQKAVAA